MKVGDTFRNAFGRGDVVTVVAVRSGGWFGWYSIDVVVGNGTERLPFTKEEVEGLLTSGAWMPMEKPAVTKGPPNCTVCGIENRWQAGPFRCWVHGKASKT